MKFSQTTIDQKRVTTKPSMKFAHRITINKNETMIFSDNHKTAEGDNKTIFIIFSLKEIYTGCPKKNCG